MVRLFFAIGLLLCSRISAHAEFLKTGAEVYQSTGKRAKVIISQEEPGIFILYGDPIELQLFDPAKVENTPTVTSAFIRYDPEGNRYVAVLVGHLEYRITGSFTLGVGEARVTVDNTNPYTTVVVDDGEGKNAEILGIMGLSVVVNFTGEHAVAVLEANQFSQYRDVLKPYKVSGSAISLEGKPLAVTSIGVALEQKNPCLEVGAVWLTAEELAEVKKGKTREELKSRLAKALAVARGRAPLKGQLKLRVAPDTLVTLDPIKGTIQHAKRVLEGSAGQQVCVLERISISNIAK
jgi:hypothetical protein